MDPREDPDGKPPGESITCGMCQQTVPAQQTRTISGRPLCLGCLAAWYSEDEDADGS
jgi:formylmethanofuran dehydrogenase subunit E